MQTEDLFTSGPHPVSSTKGVHAQGMRGAITLCTRTTQVLKGSLLQKPTYKGGMRQHTHTRVHSQSSPVSSVKVFLIMMLLGLYPKGKIKHMLEKFMLLLLFLGGGGLHPQHREVLRLGDESELQLQPTPQP